MDSHPVAIDLLYSIRGSPASPLLTSALACRKSIAAVSVLRIVSSPVCDWQDCRPFLSSRCRLEMTNAIDRVARLLRFGICIRHLPLGPNLGREREDRSQPDFRTPLLLLATRTEIGRGGDLFPIDVRYARLIPTALIVDDQRGTSQSRWCRSCHEQTMRRNGAGQTLPAGIGIGARSSG